MNKMACLTLMSMKIRLSRKASFIFTIGSNIINLSVLFFLWQNIYQPQNNPDNLVKFSTVMTSLLLANLLFALTTTKIEWSISNEIISGNIISKLTFPVGYLQQKICDYLGTLICNFFTSFLFILIILITQFSDYVFVSSAQLVVVVSIILSMIIMFIFDYLTGLTAFLTESIWGIATIKVCLVSFFSGVVVPLAFFPTHLKSLIQLTPFWYVFQTPIALITQKMSIETQLLKLLPQCLWMAILVVITMFVSKRALSNLKINGG